MKPYMTEGGAAASRAQYYDFDRAKELILKRKPHDIAKTALIDFDEEKSCFTFAGLGQEIRVTYPGCEATLKESGKQPIVHWHMPILHYLSTADGFPLSGRLVPFMLIGEHTAHPELFENETGKKLLAYFDGKPIDELKQACAALGAEALKGSGDLYYRFDCFPGFPIYFKFWYSDEETPGSCKFLFDEKCTHYLEEMDIQMMGPLLANFLIAEHELSGK